MKQAKRQVRERWIAAALRIALAAAVLLLNILAVVVLTFYLRANAVRVFIVLEIVGIIAAVDIQSRSGSVSYKLAWTMLVVSLPVAGLILYLLWGGHLQTKRLAEEPRPPQPGSVTDSGISAANLDRLKGNLPHWHRTASMLAKGQHRLYRDTDVTYFKSGGAYFADEISRMEKAEHFIFMEFFILAEGKLWDRIIGILEEKARSGIEVKILFDDFGSMTRMSREMVARMREAGIEVVIFNPVHQYVNRLYFNYRDHRKIIVIDGQYAYTGGLNVADEYAGFIRRFGEWKDCGVLLDGMGAWGLTTQFILTWETLGHKLHNEHDYYRPVQERRCAGWCQPFADGPANNPDNPAEDLFLQCIYNARDYIWLTTPYFAVEDGMVRALCIAADSGVDVRLMLPGIPDHKFTHIVAGSYFETLMAHGVKIYRFTPGFLHGKTFLADGEAAMVGTVNMDYRSFQLHYECGVALYGMDAITSLKADMEDILRRSEAVEPAKWKKRPGIMRVIERVLRIFSIWM